MANRAKLGRGEGLGRNIAEQLPKAPQLEGLAACGQPHCNGCYEIGPDSSGHTMTIHPPRSDY